MKKSIMNSKAKHIVMIVIGTFLVAVAFSLFFIPNEIAPGGVSGFATLLNALFGLPVGWIMLLCNVPLFLFGWKNNGMAFMLYSLLSTVLLSVFIEVLNVSDGWMKVVTQDLLLSTVIGGALGGLGVGIVLKQGVTTGGTDLLAMLINNLFPNISIAWVLFSIDFLVVAAAVVFLSPLVGLYALVALFIMSRVIDFVQTGIDSAKAFMIISDKSDDIQQDIIETMDRGATIIDGHGAFTKEKKNIILCVVHRNQITKLRTIVKAHDENAFIMIYNVKEVEGEGFSREN